MQATDLMIGDWVRYKESKYPFQVLCASYMGVVLPSTGGPNQREDNFEPVPLTEDILKANGFGNDWRQSELEYIDKGNGWFLVDIEAESIEDGVVTKGCRYVHEVQHALRICKRNELADNFKLK